MEDSKNYLEYPLKIIAALSLLSGGMIPFIALINKLDYLKLLILSIVVTIPFWMINMAIALILKKFGGELHGKPFFSKLDINTLAFFEMFITSISFYILAFFYLFISLHSFVFLSVSQSFSTIFLILLIGFLLQIPLHKYIS